MSKPPAATRALSLGLDLLKSGRHAGQANSEFWAAACAKPILTTYVVANYLKYYLRV